MKKKLNDLFDSWASGGGIFNALQDLAVPWQVDDIASELDLEYHGNWSGDKITSPLLDKIVEGDTITSQERDTLASLAFNMFGPYWVKQWATMSLEYDPIENYRMVEEMTDDETVTEYGKTNTRTDDLTHTKEGTETDTPTLVTKNENGVFGFNSSEPVPSDEQTSMNVSGTDEVEYDLTEKDSGTVKDELSGEDTQTRNYHLERSGNIGVTTSQQMIESERNLWKWNFFMDIVFPDLDKVLTTQVY